MDGWMDDYVPFGFLFVLCLFCPNEEALFCFDFRYGLLEGACLVVGSLSLRFSVKRWCPCPISQIWCVLRG